MKPLSAWTYQGGRPRPSYELMRGFHGASWTRTAPSSVRSRRSCSYGVQAAYTWQTGSPCKSEEPTPGLEPGTPSLREKYGTLAGAGVLWREMVD